MIGGKKMKIINMEIEKYKDFPTRYDLRYWKNVQERWIKVSSFEFESEIEQVVDFLKKEGINSLLIDTFGNNYRINMENLKYLSFIKELSIDSGSYVNIKYLYCLQDLESLWINNDNYGEEIDVSQFKHLKRLILFNSCKNINGLFSLTNLETLKLQKFKECNLTNFSNFPNLTALELVQPQITSLKGIENLKNLKCFTLFYASKLPSLAGIEQLKKLEYLEIRNCKKLLDYDSLRGLESLNRLSINFSGSLQNLNFLVNLKKLDFFGLVDTGVSDGDISLLVKVPSHGYTNKKNFNYLSKGGKDIKKIDN